MTGTPVQSPLGPTQLVDEYFIENRNRIVEIAAFLDRLDRAAGPSAATDYRLVALRDAIGILASSETSRVTRIQLLLSDPNDQPLDQLDRKGAVGAYDPAARGGRR